MARQGNLNFHGHFNGPEYDPAIDHERLAGQMQRVFDLMIDGNWRTLSEISDATGDPAASVSAQLRHLRKPRFGSFVVDRRARGDRARGLFEYRLTKPPNESERQHGSAETEAAGI